MNTESYLESFPYALICDGQRYVLGGFYPAFYYTWYATVENATPLLSVATVARICANSPAHIIASNNHLSWYWDGKRTDFSVIKEYRPLVEGVIRAFVSLDEDYAGDEKELLAALSRVTGKKCHINESLEAKKISSDLVEITEGLTKNRSESKQRVCQWIVHALFECADASGFPYYTEALSTLKKNIESYNDWADPLQLLLMIRSKMKETSVPVDWLGGEVHFSLFNGIDLYVNAVRGYNTAGFRPLMEVYSSLLNTFLVGNLFPFFLVDVDDVRTHKTGIYFGEEELSSVAQRISGRYCGICDILRKLFTEVISLQPKNFSKFITCSKLIWDALVEIEEYWSNSSASCPLCKPFLDPSFTTLDVLLNSRDIFEQASNNYQKWFISRVDSETNFVLKQFEKRLV